jgi:hypothetical protein
VGSKPAHLGAFTTGRRPTACHPGPQDDRELLPGLAIARVSGDVLWIRVDADEYDDLAVDAGPSRVSRTARTQLPLRRWVCSAGHE